MSRSARHQQAAPQRAAYPPDPPPMVYRSQEDWTAYPDQAYAAPEDQAAPRPARPGPSSAWAQGGSPRQPKKTAFWAFIALICVMVLALLGYFVWSLREPYAQFRQKANMTSQKTFAQGVFVDDVHLGGMTRAQAESALQSSAAASARQLGITIQVDGQTWVLTENELPFERNTQTVLDIAYAVGRQGTTETIGSSMTPMEYRYAHLYHTAANTVKLYTRVTYSREKVRELVGVIESHINRDPVDAMVATFDFNTRSFTFTQDQAGAKLDGDALYAQLIAALDRQDYAAVIQAASTPLTPAVTRVELMNSFALISSFTTETTSSANRNNNINLACQAVTGKVVMPGEEFSFNAATGQRTTEKGYLPAAAIAGGATVDEVGGGVCQVSSTLFNAAAMAGMTIVTRYPHTWPSKYVDKGRDATVNWPNLDFVFRNERTTPIFIIAYYQQRKCTAEIYGASLGPGEAIDLTTQIISTTYPPDTPLYEQNSQLAPGTQQEKKKARVGYVVETYRVYKRNGVEYNRDLLCTSTYKMIQQVIEYN